MDWQDVLAILSFIIGVISFVIGGFSLYFSYVSMQRTGKIQDALKEQSEQRFQRDNARKLKALVGHSRSMDTYGIYAHPVQGQTEPISIALDQLFSPYG